jgi:hypothetical protein
MAYALRATEYIEDVSGASIGGDFLNDLKSAPGNTAEMPTGYAVMTRAVIPLKRTMRDIAASMALLSRDKAYYAFRGKSDSRNYPSGDFDLRVANMEITDTRTLERWNGTSAVISTGGLDDVCRLAEKSAPDQKDIWQNFYEGDIITISRFLEESFEFGSWHFSDVPVNDRDGIALERTKSAEQEHLELAVGMLENNHRLLVQLRMMEVGSSRFLKAAADFVYGHKLQEMADESEDILGLLEPGSKLGILLEEAHSIGIFPVASALAPALEKAFHDKLLEILDEGDESGYAAILKLWRSAADLGINIEKWSLQNKIWSILVEYKSDPPASVIELAGALGFAVPSR